MLEQTAEDLNAWKTQMKVYEKNKRTKKPFGQSVQKIQHVTYEDVKNRQVLFNPVLQTYKNKGDELRRTENDEFSRAKSLMNHLKQHQKYQRNYDIVNLHGSQYDPAPQNSSIKLGPIRNAYNVINNQKLPDFHFKNRDMRLPVQRQKNLIANNTKQFNIVTNVYNKNHQQRMKNQQENEKNYIMNKYWNTHEYDPVFGKYYDKGKEEHYQQQRRVRELEHGKDYEKKFPPSYVYREAYIPDPTKPLPDSIQTLDERKTNAKKRYRLKYAIQDQYNRRNLQDESKNQHLVTNKVHNGRIQQQKSKQFDIITMKDYPRQRAQQLYRKPIVDSTWDKLHKEPPTLSKIKTGGFN